jgi:hypothetical protein
MLKLHTTVLEFLLCLCHLNFELHIVVPSPFSFEGFTIIMKFAIPAFLLLRANASVVSADQILRKGQERDRHLAEQTSGKDCTDFTVLSGPCPIIHHHG